MTKRNTPEIKSTQIEALARCLFPSIQSYFESVEGRREFAEWQSQQTTKGSSAPTTEEETLLLAS